MLEDTLGERMKRYECVTDIQLMRRTPVILRLDGCHFHTFTKGFIKPFDWVFRKTMFDTMRALCKEIPGAVFGYTQSDEITIVLVDYKKLESAAWFDYRLSKMCSVASSMASRFFNDFFIENVGKSGDVIGQIEQYAKRFNKADFDCRAFNLPKEEVCNCLIWRQKDAERNSVQALAQKLYSHKELIGINNTDLQNKMLQEKGVNWNELPVYYKRGPACFVDDTQSWFVDLEMPILCQDREYVEKHIYIGEN